MPKYWVQIAEYDSETTAYTEAAGVPSSPYTPKEDARLVGLRTEVEGDAATTLTEAVQFKLTCTTFKPNAIEVGAMGGGLRTAPFPQPKERDWPVDQQVKSGVPITIEARNMTADTPVTNSVILWACFVT